jgi:hypothetical protein
MKIIIKIICTFAVISNIIAPITQAEVRTSFSYTQAVRGKECVAISVAVNPTPIPSSAPTVKATTTPTTSTTNSIPCPSEPVDGAKYTAGYISQVVENSGMPKYNENGSVYDEIGPLIPDLQTAANFSQRYPAGAQYVGIPESITGELEIVVSEKTFGTSYRIVREGDENIVLAYFTTTPPRASNGIIYEFTGRTIENPAWLPNEFDQANSRKKVLYVQSYKQFTAPTPVPSASPTKVAFFNNSLNSYARINWKNLNTTSIPKENTPKELAVVPAPGNDVLVVPIGFDDPRSSTNDLTWTDSFRTSKGIVGSREELQAMFSEASSAIARISNGAAVPNFVIHEPVLADLNIYTTGCRDTTIRSYAKREIPTEIARYSKVFYVFATPTSADTATQTFDTCPTEGRGFLQTSRGKTNSVVAAYYLEPKTIVDLMMHHFGNKDHAAHMPCLQPLSYLATSPSRNICFSYPSTDVHDITGLGDIHSNINPIDRINMGWIATNKVQTITLTGINWASALPTTLPGAGNYTLSDYNLAPVDGIPQVIKINLQGSYSGNRKQFNYYLTNQNGKIVVHFDWPQAKASHLLDSGALPASYRLYYPNFTYLNESAAIPVTKDYFDTLNPYRITFSSINDGIATIRLDSSTNGVRPPVPPSAIIFGVDGSPQDYSQFPTGQTVSFTWVVNQPPPTGVREFKITRKDARTMTTTEFVVPADLRTFTDTSAYSTPNYGYHYFFQVVANNGVISDFAINQAGVRWYLVYFTSSTRPQFNWWPRFHEL